MKSEGISEKYRIPIKCRNISGENQKNEEEDIEMEIEVGSYVSGYCECEYIDTEISEDQWYEYGVLWRDTKIWYTQFWFARFTMWEEEGRKIEEKKNK